MASIYPFSGVRYNKAKVGDLDAVVTPPYDVISPDEEKRYFGMHPNNIVRLILPHETATQSKYERSAECLNEWLESGALARDEEPSIYAVEQEYEIFGERKKRFGFTCLLRLENYGTGTVMPHENTLAKPLGDRFELLKSTRTNFDSVFGLYPGTEVEEIIRPLTLREPDAIATDSAGVMCRLWQISDAETISKVTSAIADLPVLIADGHHRYAAALAYRDEMRAAGCTDTEAPHEFVMMTLVSLDNDGLVILPTHRLVKNLENFIPEEFIEKLSEYFDITETGTTSMIDKMEAAGAHTFGLYMTGGKGYVIRLKESIKPEEAIEGPGSDALKQLDVSVLHSLILEKLLGIDVKSLSAQTNLAYIKGAGDAFTPVDNGEGQMAFLMNATKVDEVSAVAKEGDRMPQKSTFFYPKLLTGMLIRVM